MKIWIAVFIKELFNPSVSGVYVFNCVKVVRQIEKTLYDEVGSLGRVSGRRYGILVHGNRTISMLVILKLQLKNKLGQINCSIDDEIIKEKTVQVVNQVAGFLDTAYPDSILGTFFKNSTKCGHLCEEVMKMRE